MNKHLLALAALTLAFSVSLVTPQIAEAKGKKEHKAKHRHPKKKTTKAATPKAAPPAEVPAEAAPSSENMGQ